MIIERWTWKAKPWVRDEIIELAKRWAEKAGLTPRVCTFMFGSFDTVVADLVFETEEERQTVWARMLPTEEHREMIEKLRELVVPGTSANELLRVH